MDTSSCYNPVLKRKQDDDNDDDALSDDDNDLQGRRVIHLVDEPFAGMREGSRRHKRAKSRTDQPPSEKPLHSDTDKDSKSTINLCDDEDDLRDTIRRTQRVSFGSAESQKTLPQHRQRPIGHHWRLLNDTER